MTFKDIIYTFNRLHFLYVYNNKDNFLIDLYESATQQFLGRVLQALRATAPIPGALMVKPIVKPTNINTTEPVTDSASSDVENKVKVTTEEASQRSIDSLVSD